MHLCKIICIFYLQFVVSVSVKIHEKFRYPCANHYLIFKVF